MVEATAAAEAEVNDTEERISEIESWREFFDTDILLLAEAASVLADTYRVVVDEFATRDDLVAQFTDAGEQLLRCMEELPPPPPGLASDPRWNEKIHPLLLAACNAYALAGSGALSGLIYRESGEALFFLEDLPEEVQGAWEHMWAARNMALKLAKQRIRERSRPIAWCKWASDGAGV